MTIDSWVEWVNIVVQECCFPASVADFPSPFNGALLVSIVLVLRIRTQLHYLQLVSNAEHGVEIENDLLDAVGNIAAEELTPCLHHVSLFLVPVKLPRSSGKQPAPIHAVEAEDLAVHTDLKGCSDIDLSNKFTMS